MKREDVIEREQRLRVSTALAAIAAAALILGGTIAERSVAPARAAAAQLVEFNAHSGELLTFSVMRAVGFALIAVPLVYLLRADAARSERVQTSLIGLMIAAPLFLAASELVIWASRNEVAGGFVAAHLSGARAADAAEHVLKVSTLHQIGLGLGTAGGLGISVGVFYSSLWGLRTGLLTRFLGSFGMASAAVFLLIGLGVIAWLVFLGALLLRVASLPPAWAAGEAIPWPSAGDRMAQKLEAEPGADVASDDVAGDDDSSAGEPSAAPAPEPRRKRKHRS
ncbi:MAG: hypothetical protein QOG26_1644 [Solirubrobacterales bacterium]|nr:hypothetical protein [Solirubrobacterales bacterium]